MELAVPPPGILPLVVRTTSRASLQPVTAGVVLPRGWCRDAAALGLEDPDGHRRSVHTRVLDRWSDGTVRWALLDFQVTARSAPAHYRLYQKALTETAEGLRVVGDDRGVRVEDGALAWSLTLNPLALSVSNGTTTLANGHLGIEFASGPAAWRGESIEVEHYGHLRATVALRGRMLDNRGDVLETAARFTFYAGLTQFRADFTVRNARRARHEGGLWELGDSGSIFFREASFVWRAVGDEVRRIEVRESPDADTKGTDAPVELYQESSGGANWRSLTHRDRSGDAQLAFRGFRLRVGSEVHEGLRATPTMVAAASDPMSAIAVAVPHFWQNFPQALESDGRAIVARVFARQTGRPFELQGGEQKTQSLFAAVGDGASIAALDWCLRPPIVTLAPEHWHRAGAAAAMLPVPLPTHLDPAHEALVALALDPATGFFAKREVADEYGWRNFGDMPADHEAVRAPAEIEFVSHYNNQYDGVWGCWLQFMRSGDPRWRELACDLAEHVADIDVYHTDEDKSAYNHGLFWHTFHYVDAGLSTHRGYPKARGVWGGGPSSEHNYTSGLLLQYYLTGDARYREVVLEMAGWVLAMDDGRRTPLKWIYGGPTGLASATASADYHGPGRGGAYSINTLLNAYQLTRDAVYLKTAERLLRRCIHPRDDIEARELLDAERRWSYTVFLQVLGRYLSVKEELGQLDAVYVYARASLLAYAAWMAQHETPYFDRAGSLEFATETWVAQEFRKSDVFVLAARHCDAALRDRYLERARFFHEYAVRTLGAMPTRTLTRPIVLSLTNGLLLPAIADADLAPPAEADRDLDPTDPATFYPQKAVALRRAKWAAAVAAGVCAAATALLWEQWH